MLEENTAYAAEVGHFIQWAGSDDSGPLTGQNITQLWYALSKNAS